ncbi:MAG: transposase [Clostridia bacterium]|nr:transposase [Clostridia bacterium]
MARPSKYETHVAPRLEEIKDWCRNGATDKEIAKRLGISEDSFYKYKNEFSEFSESLKENKEVVDGKVENALLQNALKGNILAQIFWLKNRRSKQWREKPVQTEDDQEKKLDELINALNRRGGESE